MPLLEQQAATYALTKTTIGVWTAGRTQKLLLSVPERKLFVVVVIKSQNKSKNGALERALEQVNHLLDKRNPFSNLDSEGQPHDIVALELEWSAIVGIDFLFPLHQDARLVLEANQVTKRFFHVFGDVEHFYGWQPKVRATTARHGKQQQEHIYEGRTHHPVQAQALPSSRRYHSQPAGAQHGQPDSSQSTGRQQQQRRLSFGSQWGSLLSLGRGTAAWVRQSCGGMSAAQHAAAAPGASATVPSFTGSRQEAMLSAAAASDLEEHAPPPGRRRSRSVTLVAGRGRQQEVERAARSCASLSPLRRVQPHVVGQAGCSASHDAGSGCITASVTAQDHPLSLLPLGHRSRAQQMDVNKPESGGQVAGEAHGSSSEARRQDVSPGHWVSGSRQPAAVGPQVLPALPPPGFALPRRLRGASPAEASSPTCQQLLPEVVPGPPSPDASSPVYGPKCSVLPPISRMRSVSASDLRLLASQMAPASPHRRPCVHRSSHNGSFAWQGSAAWPVEGQLYRDVPAAARWTAASAVYHGRTLVINFEEAALTEELRQFVKSDLRLLKLYESGLPAWAIFLPSYGLYYRPWMRRATWLLYIAVSFVSMACGFYDLYKNIPFVKEFVSSIMARIHLPAAAVFEWLERHTQIRLSILLTWLFSRSPLFSTALRVLRSALVLLSQLLAPLVTAVSQTISTIAAAASAYLAVAARPMTMALGAAAGYMQDLAQPVVSAATTVASAVCSAASVLGGTLRRTSAAGWAAVTGAAAYLVLPLLQLLWHLAAGLALLLQALLVGPAQCVLYVWSGILVLLSGLSVHLGAVTQLFQGLSMLVWQAIVAARHVLLFLWRFAAQAGWLLHRLRSLLAGTGRAGPAAVASAHLARGAAAATAAAVSSSGKGLVWDAAGLFLSELSVVADFMLSTGSRCLKALRAVTNFLVTLALTMNKHRVSLLLQARIAVQRALPMRKPAVSYDAGLNPAEQEASDELLRAVAADAHGMENSVLHEGQAGSAALGDGGISNTVDQTFSEPAFLTGHLSNIHRGYSHAVGLAGDSNMAVPTTASLHGVWTDPEHVDAVNGITSIASHQGDLGSGGLVGQAIVGSKFRAHFQHAPPDARIDGTSHAVKIHAGMTTGIPAAGTQAPLAHVTPAHWQGDSMQQNQSATAHVSGAGLHQRTAPKPTVNT